MPPPPPQTPAHEESGQPLNERPGKKAGDFVERDLWNLEHDNDDGTTAPTEEKITPRQKPLPSDTPAGDDKPTQPEPPDPYDEPKPAPVVPRKEIHTLEPLDDDEPDLFSDQPAAISDEPVEQETTGETVAEAAGEVEVPDDEAVSEDEPQDQPADDIPPADDKPADDKPADSEATGETSEFDEAALETKPAPAAEKTLFRLSKTELVSLSVLLLAILIGGGWAVKTFFAEIPTRESKVMVPDFPVHGERLSVKTADTFWRKPVRTGDNPDTARMAAQLIPVLDMELAEKDGQGALRFFFRDAEGQLVGDSVTRAFSGGNFTATKDKRNEIAATDGFDDEGKHAAYQTSQTEPWIVEVFEGPQATASFESFTLLFKTPISTDRR